MYIMYPFPDVHGCPEACPSWVHGFQREASQKFIHKNRGTEKKKAKDREQTRGKCKRGKREEKMVKV